jgi:DNA-binding CsgD family transcriptional regulator
MFNIDVDIASAFPLNREPILHPSFHQTFVWTIIMHPNLHTILNDRVRLEELAALCLLDTPPEEPFDRLTRVAAQALGTPIALVSLVDHNRQFFKSACGLLDPLASIRETPLSHSFCQHVVAGSAPLIISDARVHPLVCRNMAVAELGVIAYLGVPLALPHGMTLGSFCVIDIEPRHWTKGDRHLMTSLAASVMSEIALRSAQSHIHLLQQTLAHQQIKIRAAQQLAHFSQQLMFDDQHSQNGHWIDATQTSLRHLTEAVHHVLSIDAGEPPSIIGLSLDQLRERLTSRQLEVFDLLMRGLQTKEIARHLDLSPRTVEVHRAKILERLHISSFSVLLKQLLARPDH